MRVAVLALCVFAGASMASLPYQVELRDVPQEVKEASDRAAPGVEWLEAIAFTPRNRRLQTWYDLTGREAAGKKRLVHFGCRQNGSRGVVRVEFALADVPGPVRTALKAARPYFIPGTVQLVGPSVVSGSYHFRGREARIPVTYVVSPDGKLVTRD